jgi:hypothetical protein
MKTSKKLTAYKQANQDRLEASQIVTDIRKKMTDIGSIEVGSTITINSDSSDKQFVYAVGVLMNQTAGAQVLGFTEIDYAEKLVQVTALWELRKDLKSWDDYVCALRRYEHEIYALLSDDELFQLLERPVKK